MDIFRYDQILRGKGYHRIAGIDEAGRGPLAGPVVAAAVVLKENAVIDRLRDSKQVPAKEREVLRGLIEATALDIGIGVIGPEEVDRLNVMRATRLAMSIAIEQLAIEPDLLIIDAISIPSITIPQHSPVRAESISASVAAASIVAKETRDTIMLEYHDVYPVYNFRKHKGYATREHLEMLQRYGPCPIHRKSFARVRSLALPL